RERRPRVFERVRHAEPRPVRERDEARAVGGRSDDGLSNLEHPSGRAEVDGARLRDRAVETDRAAVEPGKLGSIDVHLRGLDPESPEGREEMLDRVHLGGAVAKNGAPGLNVEAREAGANARRAIEVRAHEDDAAIRRRGASLERHLSTEVKAEAADRHGMSERSLAARART